MGISIHFIFFYFDGFPMRQVVTGMVTRARSSTSLNLITSSMLETDRPDFLEFLLVILSRKEGELCSVSVFCWMFLTRFFMTFSFSFLLITSKVVSFEESVNLIYLTGELY